MRRRTTVVAAALATLVMTPALAFGGLAGSAANEATYPDAAGDSAGGPDITSVAVANDDAGLITMQVNVSNRPALTPDMLFVAFLDTVPGAGDSETLGADYILQLETAGAALFKWNGSDFAFADEQSSLSYEYRSSGPVFRISAGDLGKTKAFNLVVLAVSGITYDAAGNPNFDNIRRDFAPDLGAYSYQVLTTLRLSAVAVTTGPKPAKAGGTLAVALGVTRNDTGGPVLQGTVTCTAKIAGKRVPVKSRRVSNGVAACLYSLPRNAKGQTIRGTIALTVDGTTVSKAFSARIS